MLVLRPEMVELDGVALDGVTAISVERAPGREVVDFGDLGPYAAFVDVPERRVTVRVTRSADVSLGDDALPGASVTLEFVASLGRTDRGRSRVTVTGVVTRVSQEFGSQGVSRVMTLAGVSPDGGASDPVVVEAF